MKTKTDLDGLLSSLGGKAPSVLKKIEGVYNYGDFELVVDSVPDNPVGNPIRLRVRISVGRAGFAQGIFSTKSREIAARDFLARSFATRIRQFSRKQGDSACIAIDCPSQEMLETSAVVIGGGIIEVRFAVDFPLHKGAVSGAFSSELFMKRIPNLVKRSLFFKALDVEAFTQWIETAEDTAFIRGNLKEAGLAAFIADGSIVTGPLGGGTKTPMKAPDELAVTFDLPNRGKVRGMGIPKGITVIAGGYGHGKSSLVSALALGVYDHVPGDGRELIVTVPDAVAVRSEEGRRVDGVDISAIVKILRGGIDVERFSAEDASSVLSLAANIAEALEVGTSLLLFDDDTVPAPLLSHDGFVRNLVEPDDEPITPLIDILPVLRDNHGISSVVALGGCGEFFDIADTVILMKDFMPSCVTDTAKNISGDRREAQAHGDVRSLKLPRPRCPLGMSMEPPRRKSAAKARPRGVGYVQYGDEFIEMPGVTQLVSVSQARGIARGLALAHRLMDGSRSLEHAVKEVMKRVETVGLDTLSNRCLGDLAGFRAHELAAAVNRLKRLKVK